MSLIVQRETTEFFFHGVNFADLPSGGAQLAFMGAGVRPQEIDWETAIVVDAEHALRPKAVATGLAGAYHVAILIGPFGDALDLGVGDYQVWLRLTNTPERPVRIMPVALEIL